MAECRKGIPTPRISDPGNANITHEILIQAELQSQRGHTVFSYVILCYVYVCLIR